ncbi:MAG: twitching motility protein PilT [Methanothermobacter sp.]|nr:twitching motility protein PilT [Methanothermobacter sp.]
MIPFQFKVDIISELERIAPNGEFIIPSFVIDELKKIKMKSKGKDRIAARIALKLAEKGPFKIVNLPLGKDESVDDALIRLSDILCTNDKELRRKARRKGVPVIYLRQKKYLTINGYIS